MPRKTGYEDIKNRFELYSSKWKFIAIVLLCTFILAYIHLRYSTAQYRATTTIEIKEEKQNNQFKDLTSLQSFGPFASNLNKVIDEIEIIKSRRLLRNVVKDLRLNIGYFVQGRIKEQEVYINPPITMSFFESDSLINTIDTTLFVNIKSNDKLLLYKEDPKNLFNLNGQDAVNYSFGDRIKSGFGDFVLTPNPGTWDVTGRNVKIKLTSVENVVSQLQQSLKISHKEASNIITIQINQNIPEKANLILNKLVEEYNKDVINDKEEIVKVTSNFINDRLTVVSSELEQVDYTAENLQKDNRLTALQSQSNIFLQSERENESRLVETSNQIQLIDYLTDYLSENNANSDLLPADVGIADNSVAQLTKSHNELVLQRNRILKNSSEKNPVVINLDDQISALKANLNQSLENIKSTNKITLDALNREDRRISAQIYSAPTKARKFRDITRQQSIKESLYLYLLEKREETAITLGMSSPNAKIVDIAYASNTPVAPNRQITYLAALILGLGLPIGLIYLKDILDTHVHDKKDLKEVLNIPFIGDIPLSSKKQRLIKKVDYSPKAEAFRIVRSNIDFMLKGNKSTSKIIFVTSTTSKEGKSHTSLNLASSISFSGRKTLVLETDIRVPKVNEYLNIKTQKGLTDYISDPEIDIKDVTVKVKENDNLDIIPSGTIPPNPAELLMNSRIDKLFASVKKSYEYIIVDSSAIGLVTDTLLIGHHADMVIYVVSADNIDKRELHIAQTAHDENRLPNMVVLLNGTKKKKGYGYGYGSNPSKKKWYQFG